MSRLGWPATNIAVLVVVGLLSGCGGKGAAPTKTTAPAPAGGAAGALKIAADPSGALKFDVASLTAKAGKVTIDFTNKSPVAHDVRIEGPGGKQLGGTSTIAGSSTTASVTLAPGTYTFYCSVDAHRQAGMQGKLTVK